MPPDYKSTLEELVKAREDAREVLKELHGVLKDVKRARAEVLQMINRGTTLLVMECLNEELDKTIEKVNIHLDHILAEAIEKVSTRFNEIAAVLDEREEVLNDTVKTVQSTATSVSRFLENERKARGFYRT